MLMYSWQTSSNKLIFKGLKPILWHMVNKYEKHHWHHITHILHSVTYTTHCVIQTRKKVGSIVIFLKMPCIKNVSLNNSICKKHMCFSSEVDSLRLTFWEDSQREAEPSCTLLPWETRDHTRAGLREQGEGVVCKWLMTAQWLVDRSQTFLYPGIWNYLQDIWREGGRRLAVNHSELGSPL